MTFDEWWKQTKPAECDELKPYFEEAWEISATTEREACAKVCEGLEDCFADHLSNNAAVAALVCADKIRMRSNVRSQATDAALSRQVACTDGLGVAVPPAPTIDEEIGNG